MKTIERTVACLLSIATLSGCGGSYGTFTEEGYVSEYPFTVEYADASRRTFVSDDWVLDSHRPAEEPPDRRRGADHVSTFELDMDDDGVVDRVGSRPTYEIRLRHRRNEGMLWVRSLILPPEVESQRLDVLANAYAESIAGAGYLTATVHGRREVRVEERRYATDVLDRLPMDVSGKEAYGILFDVANVNQLMISEDSRTARAAVTFIRANYGWEERDGNKTRTWPILLMVGYANQPADFEAGLEDYHRLLSSLAL